MLALSARPVTDGRMIPLPSTGLELHGVEVTYGNRRFLHGLDLQVRPGELVVVSGPPGSGKTTLAGIASGLVDPDEGDASLDGVALDDLDPGQLRQTIRVVSEEPLLLAATLARQPAARGMGRDRRRGDARRDAHGGGRRGDRGARRPRRRRRRPRPHRVRRPAPARVARPCARRPSAGAHPRRRALRGEPLARGRDHAAGARVPAGDRHPLHHPADRPRRDGRSIASTSTRPSTVEPFADVARSELLDGTAETAGGAETAEAMQSVATPSRRSTPSSRSAWRPRSPRASVQVQAGATAGSRPSTRSSPSSSTSSRSPKRALDIPDGVTDDDTRPRFWKIAQPVPARRCTSRCSWCSSSRSESWRRASLFGRVTDIIQDSNGADTERGVLLGRRPRVHRGRRGLRVEVLPDLRAAVQPERDRRAAPSCLLPPEQARRELLRP